VLGTCLEVREHPTRPPIITTNASSIGSSGFIDVMGPCVFIAEFLQ